MPARDRGTARLYCSRGGRNHAPDEKARLTRAAVLGFNKFIIAKFIIARISVPKEPIELNFPWNLYLMRFLRASWVLLWALAVLLVIYFMLPAVYPFLIGWFIAWLLNPLVNVLQKKAKFPRWLATTTAIVAFLGGLSVLVMLLVNKLVLEIGRFAKMVEENMGNWIAVWIDLFNSDQIQNFLERLTAIYTRNEQWTQTIDQNLSNAGQKVTEAVTGLINAVLNGVIGFIAALPGATFVLIIAILAAFFISKDWYKWMARLSSVVPEHIKRPYVTVWSNLKKALFGYVRAQLIMISITAVFVTLGLLIMRVPYAVTIGLLIGLVDLLPYLGVGAAMVPWIVYEFVTGDIGLGIGLTVLYGIVFVTRSIIEPKVLAFSIGMDALTTLIAMMVGLHFLGAVGIIVGPVTLVILIAMHQADIFKDLWKYVMGKEADGRSA